MHSVCIKLIIILNISDDVGYGWLCTTHLKKTHYVSVTCIIAYAINCLLRNACGEGELVPVVNKFIIVFTFCNIFLGIGSRGTGWWYHISLGHVQISNVEDLDEAMRSQKYHHKGKPNRRQVIIWTSHGLVCWHICVPDGLDELSECPLSRWFSARLQYPQCISDGDTLVLR